MTGDKFYKGETVSCFLEVRTKQDNVLIDPTSVTITIINGKSGTTKVDASAMTKSSVGKYSYLWLSDEIGDYKVIYNANNSGSITILKDEFSVSL